MMGDAAAGAQMVAFCPGAAWHFGAPVKGLSCLVARALARGRRREANNELALYGTSQKASRTSQPRAE